MKNNVIQLGYVLYSNSIVQKMVSNLEFASYVGKMIGYHLAGRRCGVTSDYRRIQEQIGMIRSDFKYKNVHDVVIYTTLDKNNEPRTAISMLDEIGIM